MSNNKKIQTDRQTEKHTHIETDRQTSRKIKKLKPQTIGKLSGKISWQIVSNEAMSILDIITCKQMNNATYKTKPVLPL